jgi:hypothetical protein
MEYGSNASFRRHTAPVNEAGYLAPAPAERDKASAPHPTANEIVNI